MPDKPIVRLFQSDGDMQPSFMPFYQRMRKYENDVTIHYDNPSTPRILIVMTGKACKAKGVDAGLCKRVLEDGGSVSRIDLAMTTNMNFLGKIVEDSAKVESKLYPTGIVIADMEYTPQTIYYGDFKKRGKNGIVRAYDKGLQLGLDGLEMYRLEVENKRKHANITSKRLAHGESICDCMNAKFKVNADWYRELMGSGVSTKRFPDVDGNEMSEIDRKMAWLQKQVLPSLQYVLDYDNENGTNNFESIINKLDF